MDIIKTAKEILATVAPTVATALGGPLAGVAVKALGKALGLEDGVSEDQVLEHIAKADPETLLKIKQAENDFKLKMKELEVNLVKLGLEDGQSARKREVETKDTTPKILAYLIVSLYIAIQIYLVTGHVIPPEMREMVMRALGTLDAALGMALQYYYGSTIGSKQKTVQIDKLLDEVAANGRTRS